MMLGAAHDTRLHLQLLTAPTGYDMLAPTQLMLLAPFQLMLLEPTHGVIETCRTPP